MIWAAMSSAGVGPLCSCGSVVVHCVSSAKGCGFNSQGTHILKKCIVWMHCKSLWIKASAKCINVNVFWSPVNAAIYQDIFEHFMLPSADQLFKEANFIFQQDLAPAHTAKKHQKLVKWPWCWCAWLASKLTRPEPQRIYGILSRGKWETRDQKMQMSWRPRSKKPGLPYHLSSATNWSPPCHAELRQ